MDDGNALDSIGTWWARAIWAIQAPLSSPVVQATLLAFLAFVAILAAVVLLRRLRRSR